MIFLLRLSVAVVVAEVVIFAAGVLVFALVELGRDPK